MKIKKAERTCTCRGCNKTMRPGDDIFHTYSYISRGTTVIFCMPCVDEIIKMKNEFNIVQRSKNF